MDFRLRLVLVLTLSLFLQYSFVLAQSPKVVAVPFSTGMPTGLEEHFTSYQTYHLNTSTLVGIVRDADFGNRLSLELPGIGDFDIDLFENPILAQDYVLRVATETGVQAITGAPQIVKTYRGNLSGGQYVVSLTIDYGFVQGFIQLPGKDELQIEPLRNYIDDAAVDAFILYKASDVIETEEHTCNARHHVQRKYNTEIQQESMKVVGECRTVQIAFADDWLMFDDHGNNVTQVENANMAVINDVQNNYDNEFADDLIFSVTEIWVSTCSTCDPWSNTTNSGDLLDEFRSWGQTGGFSNVYDVADLWTDRDFNGPTIGVSWVEAVCTSFRYLTTQDFSSSAGALRSLLAHELGHNFGSDHDPAGSQTIMAPSLVVTNTWSAASINMINNYIDDINCLSLCMSLQAPSAAFSSDNESGCAPFVVHFFDESTGPPSTWQWTFPGGTPGSSTSENPTVTYHNAGVYDVVLQVTNAAGTNSIVMTDYITVLDDPIADFLYDQDELTLFFTNLSENGSTYLWNFGDGGSSTQFNPSHTYDEDGEYMVTLTVTNACGVDQYFVNIDVFTQPTAGFSYSTDFGCAPLVVSFFNESSSNAESFEWFFPGGNPATSTQENPVVTYSNPGTYSVTLIVENAAGVDQVSVNNLIEVDPQPDAVFNFAVNGLSVQFVNNSTNADSYLWQFGDGGTSTSQNPNHDYVSGGTYSVTLTASNDCGNDVFVLPVTLNSAPTAAFLTSVSNGCVPQSVQYTSVSTGTVTSYNWSFPGGSPSSSTSMSPVVVYNAPGNYSAQLIVGNSVGFDTVAMVGVVTIFADPVAAFMINLNGNAGTFTNTSTGASIYNWMVNGSSFGSQNLNYTFPGDGDYPVQLIATGLCGSDTVTQVVHIASAPTAGIASSVTSGCQPLTVQFFNASSANVTAWAWVFEGGTPATSSDPNPIITYNQPGQYDVQLTVTSAGGMDMLVLSDMIEVSPLPIAMFSTVQTGLQIGFNNNSLNADQYFWTFGDGGTSTETSPSHTYGTFGTYTVSLVTQNACGMDTMTINLVLSGAPVPVFNVQQTNGCVPFEVQFVDQSQNGPELWEWSFPGGSPDTSNLQNPVIVYWEPGVYSVTLRVSNAGGAQALVRDEYIYVANPPLAEFTSSMQNGQVSFINQSQGGTSYLWNFGDGALDTTANPVHNYSTSGNYPVQLIVFNACSSDTILHVVNVTVTAVDDLTNTLNLRVYPNPNTGTFNIELPDDQQEYTIALYDLYGHQINGLHEIVLGHRHQFNMRDAAPGVYSVVVSREGLRRVVKMVVVGQ